jgi:hypothetical protein
MAARVKRRSRRKSAGRKAKRRFKLPSLTKGLPRKATLKRWFKRYRAAPAGLQISLALVALVAAWFCVNFIYQVARKPSELFFPVSGVLYKTPSETWATYAPIFRRHSTATITPDFLAALAQVEGSGNPIVRTYWRWRMHSDPFEIYRPASSAVGMYQITDGTFAEARRYCIHDHVVVEDGPWHDWRSCWFNSLYMRTVPSHAAELTSAYLDRKVTTTLAAYGVKHASLKQKQELAALIHLCGAGVGRRYVANGFRLPPGYRCGDHSAQAYIDKVERMKRVFQRLASKD